MPYTGITTFFKCQSHRLMWWTCSSSTLTHDRCNMIHAISLTLIQPKSDSVMSEMDCFQNYTQCVCGLTSKLTMKCISTCGVQSDWKVTSDSRLSSGPGTNKNAVCYQDFHFQWLHSNFVLFEMAKESFLMATDNITTGIKPSATRSHKLGNQCNQIKPLTTCKLLCKICVQEL